MNCVQSDLKEEKKTWKWNFIKEWITDKRKYISYWYEMKTGKFQEKNKKDFDELEEKWPYNTIYFFRELGDNLYFKEKKRIEEVKKSNTGLISWVWGSQSLKFGDIEMSPEVMKDLYSSLNINEKDDLSSKKYPPDYVKMKVDLHVKSFNLGLKITQKESLYPLVNFELNDFQIQNIVRENSLSIVGTLKSSSLVDYYTKKDKPFFLISPVKKDKEQINLEFHTNPLAKNVDLLIRGDFRYF